MNTLRIVPTTDLPATVIEMRQADGNRWDICIGVESLPVTGEYMDTILDIVDNEVFTLFGVVSNPSIMEWAMNSPDTVDRVEVPLVSGSRVLESHLKYSNGLFVTY